MSSLPIMKEHRPTLITKTFFGLLFFGIAIEAAYNIVDGTVSRPSAFYAVLIGFILFATGKLSVILRKKKVSFGTKMMSERMANIYRLGYWVMMVGLLATFCP